MGNVLVVAEHVDGALRKVTLQTITFAKQAAAITGGKVHVLVLGNGVDHIGQELAPYADAVHVANSPAFTNYLAENYAPAIAKAAKAIDAEVICAPSSTFGKDIVPTAAVL